MTSAGEEASATPETAPAGAPAAAASPPSVRRRPAGRWQVRKLPAVLALVALADWLFYGHEPGISILLFLAAVVLAAAFANPIRATRRELMLAAGLFAAAALPLVIEVRPLAVLFAVAGTAMAAVMVTRRCHWTQRLAGAAALLLKAGWLAFVDLVDIRTWWPFRPVGAISAEMLMAWLLPLGLGAVFVALFASANPLIEDWLTALDPSRLLSQFSVVRLMFWLLVLSLVWPFVFMRRHIGRRPVAPAPQPDAEQPGVLFGKAAILRSLVVFNLLFAVQSGLDLAYLWADADLPAGMTHAAYAHRGAYPLIATALIAAGFAVAAMRPGSAAERSGLVRGLMVAWIGQNLLLVVSSMLRLDLYVEAYSLTYWRLAAFFWMLLVAAGLVLIVVRMVGRRTTAWLLRANGAAVAVVLYAWCLINVPEVIAGYNVAHSREATGAGSPLDASYLFSLGPQAIPWIDRWLADHPAMRVQSVRERRDLMASRHLIRMQDWRAWSYRDAALASYLRAQPR